MNTIELFLVAMLAAYVRYTRRQTPGRYLAVVCAFGAALLAKPTVAIAPCTLTSPLPTSSSSTTATERASPSTSGMYQTEARNPSNCWLS